MRYRGQIGEFKWWAFLLWIVGCFAIALGIYRHLAFATIPQGSDTVTTNQSAKKIKEIETEAEACKARILALEQQIKPPVHEVPAKQPSKASTK